MEGLKDCAEGDSSLEGLREPQGPAPAIPYQPNSLLKPAQRTIQRKHSLPNLVDAAAQGATFRNWTSSKI